MESYYLGMKLRSLCSSSPNLNLMEYLGTAFVCRTLHCSHAILTKDNKDTGNPTEERWNLIIWARSSEAHANCCPICSSSPNLYLLEHLGTAFVCLTLHQAHAILNKDNKGTGNPTVEQWNLIIWT